MNRILIILALFLSSFSWAQSSRPDAAAQKIKTQVYNRLEPLLTRLCADACDIVDVDVTMRKVSNGMDMGFESTADSVGRSDLEVDQIRVDIQIDSRVTEENKSRLKKIIKINLRPFTSNSGCPMVQVMVPENRTRKASCHRIKGRIRVSNQRYGEEGF